MKNQIHDSYCGGNTNFDTPIRIYDFAPYFISTRIDNQEQEEYLMPREDLQALEEGLENLCEELRPASNFIRKAEMLIKFDAYHKIVFVGRSITEPHPLYELEVCAFGQPILKKF